jgi:hypothetical protein
MSLRWYNVCVTIDGDEVGLYAVEASDDADARNIALERLPDPDTRVTLLDGTPDDSDYDDVIAHDT